MVNKILSSKILRFVFSAILIFFAFRKVHIFQLLQEMKTVPLWFIVAVMIYLIVTMFVGGIRWSYLVLKKPTWKDFWNFTKANYYGGFYSLFFPSSVAGDVIKWVPLHKNYPDISRTKLAGSIIIDRVIGFTAFSIMGFVALIVGRILKYQFPDVLLWFFSAIALGIVVFYVLVFTVDFEKLLGKISWLRKLIEIVDLLKGENKSRIFKVFLIALIGEPIWQLPIWFYSLIFHAGISLLQVYIFIPVITLILILPISIAGFGARENLYLLFFGALGIADEKILLVSTFGGLLGVLNALIGGLLLLF